MMAFPEWFEYAYKFAALLTPVWIAWLSNRNKRAIQDMHDCLDKHDAMVRRITGEPAKQ